MPHGSNAGEQMKPPTTKQIVAWSILLTALIEGVTAFFRFGLGRRAAEETASTVGRMTGGIRIHHGYLGVVAALVAVALLRRFPVAARWLLIVGIATAASDLVHHFLVLWPVVGSPQFDLLYPDV